MSHPHDLNGFFFSRKICNAEMTTHTNRESNCKQNICQSNHNTVFFFFTISCSPSYSDTDLHVAEINGVCRKFSLFKRCCNTRAIITWNVCQPHSQQTMVYGQNSVRCIATNYHHTLSKNCN